jgi:hypothetical protein
MERDIDGVYLMHLAHKLGSKFGPTSATPELNDLRAHIARQSAISEGLSEDEIEQRVRESALSRSAVAGQIARLREQTQRAASMGMAALIDDQIVALQDDVNESMAVSRRILRSIEHAESMIARIDGSMPPEVARARQIISEIGLDGLQAGNDLQEIINSLAYTPDPESTQDDTLEQIQIAVSCRSKLAPLYARLLAERAHRRELAAEMRKLRYGRELMGNHPTSSLLESLSGESDPSAARDAAEQEIQAQVARLIAAGGASSLSPDFALMHQQGLRNAETQIRLHQMSSNMAGDEENKERWEVIGMEPSEDNPSRFEPSP